MTEILNIFPRPPSRENCCDFSKGETKWYELVFNRGNVVHHHSASITRLRFRQQLDHASDCSTPNVITI